jgi:exopolysaccharide biosynthesis polyprenyl glycosylphosphotransferase
MTLIDLMSLIAALVLTDIIAVRSPVMSDMNIGGLPGNIAIGGTFVAMSLAFLWLMRLRASLMSPAGWFSWTQVVGVVSFVAMLTSLGWLMLLPGVYNHLLGALIWALSIAIIPLGEILAHKVYRLLKRSGSHHMPVIIVGNGSSATAARKRFESEPRKYQFVATVDLAANSSNGQNQVELSRAVQINSYARTNGGVLVATPASQYKELQSIVNTYSLRDRGRVHVTLYPHIDSEDSSAEIVETQPKRFSWQYEKIKRCLDLVVAVSSLVLASPLILLLAALIKLDSRGPLFFGQMRVGRNGQVFKMYKFRSMCANAENMLDELTEKNKAKGHMFKIDDDPRVTRVGKWIRRLSLDEIPQLFNVITGEMSLIGPRPPLPHEVKEYEPWQFRRLEAAPGISGLWQVKRGSEISFDEMVNLDIEYIDNWSLWMDIAIIIKTIPAMMRGQGAY